MIELPNYTLPHEFFTYIDTAVGGWGGKLILLTIFVLTFTSLRNIHPARAFTGAIFLTSVVGVIFFTLGLVQMTTFSICLLGLLFAGVSLKFTQN